MCPGWPKLHVIVMVAEWLEAQSLLLRVVSWSVRSGSILGNPTIVSNLFFLFFIYFFIGYSVNDDITSFYCMPE